MVLATGMHAHVAASTGTLLLSLGINRVAQAAVIVPRAMAMGVPFAPEKDGRSFMADTITRGTGDGYDARDRHDADDRDRYNQGGGGRRNRRQPWDQR
jgi:hypothetical protein